ncbi:hypothetical protein [Occultella kanbiaonis]|uniref:hypothetical protein n=1 Tax=Occultella kanbiaonis TaxID=2675754 RepID=UPI0013D87FB9|nr:hypothetical protein [Occultella kanbiaonis]
MSVIFDYFAAKSDREAAAVIGREGGPASEHEVVQSPGIDPVVRLGKLEEILTGRPYGDIAQDPRIAQPVALQNEGQRVVVGLTDGIAAGLASATQASLALAAITWADTEEFWGMTAPEDLIPFLTDLSALARTARADDSRLYCWICV